jgi:hypothetical protein
MRMGELKRMDRLLLIASVGILFDGLTTVLGTYLGIEESNPLVGVVGLGGSLLIRVGAIILLYALVGRLHKTSDIRWVTIWLYILIAITWGAVILNGAAIIFIGVYA